MSGGAVWEPFTISEHEYGELLEALAADGYEAGPEPPAWVTTEGRWHTWLDALKVGSQPEELRQLVEAEEAADAAYKASWDEAVRERDPMLVPRRWRQSLAASRALQDARKGRTPGTRQRESMEDPQGIAASRAVDAQMALRAAQRIGDPELIAHWEREQANAEQDLVAAGGDPRLAKFRAMATDWR